ncbi:MAG TPA: sugar ABC transporter substrate-binding protein [Spirochaetia bacterium]|nr:sugar ABC transporter substrate-binding protein [Spirochaetia bacterium]
MKRLPAVLASALLALAMASPLSAENAKLTFVYWGSVNEDTAMKEAFKAFEAANPGITVEPMYIQGDISGTEYAAKLRAMAQTNTLPDLGYFRPDQFGEFAAAGYMMDLTDLVQKEGLTKDYLPQVWLKVKDRIFGAYTAAECQVMFYNKDVLKKAGVPVPPSDYRKAWTWDQFVKYCIQVTTDANGKHPGDAGFDANRITTYGVSYQLWHAMLTPPLWSGGGGIVSADGRKVLIDSPESVDVIQKIADLINKQKVMPYTNPSSTSQAGLPTPPVMLANGQLAFYITGQWELLDIAKMNFPMGIGALPIIKKPAQMYISGASVIFKSTKFPKEAWLLHKWMMTPDKTLNLYTSGLWMPTKASWYNDAADLKKWTDNAVHPAEFKSAVLDSMKIAEPIPEVRVKNYTQIINECVNPQLDKVWLGEISAKDALKKAGDLIRQQNLMQGTW